LTIPIADAQITFAGALCVIAPITPLTGGLNYTMTIGQDVIRDAYGGNGYRGVGNPEAAHSYTFSVSSPSNSVKITFKSGGESGYLSDSGALFSYQSDQHFGWKCNGVNQALTGSINAWGTYADRLNACVGGVTSWEIELADGVYHLQMIMGCDGSPGCSYTGCAVQGQAISASDLSPTAGTSGSYTYSKQVTISNGVLQLAGDFPLCHGYQEVALTPPTEAEDQGCTNKMDGYICGPNQELHIAAGECVLMVKPSGSACNQDTKVPLNPLHLVQVPNDGRFVPYVSTT